MHIQTQDNQVRYKVSDQMQKKIPHILIAIFALSGLLYYSANAQEGPNETPEREIKELSSHPELNLDDDKTLILESEQQKPGNHAVIKEKIGRAHV